MGQKGLVDSLTRAAAKKPLLFALVLSALVLAATTDERAFGLVSDGQIMSRTAYSMAELGEIGMARGHSVNISRPEGDAVTRYGMGFSLVQAPVMFVAGRFEKAFGPGSSQTLFVLEQVLLVLLAALAAGALARSWGSDALGVRRAVLATAISSPLWGYAGTDYSEPLQSACLGGAFAFAALSLIEGGPATPGKRDRLYPLLSGVCAGAALLSKSVYIVLLPFLLAAFVLGSRKGERVRRGLAALLGWTPLAAVWLAFEVVRFGRPFASYGGEHFIHPLFDGLWRLTVGPTKGFFLYFPVALLGFWGARVVYQKSRALAIATLCFVGFLFGSSAMWWAWSGTGGWGPRLVVPVIPLVAAVAATAAARLPAPVFRTLFALGFALNLLGAIVIDPPRLWYYTILPGKPLTPAEAAQYPPWSYIRTEKGPRLEAIHYVADNAAFSPIKVALWFLKIRLEGGDILKSMQTPPWRTDVPGQEVETPPEQSIPSTALLFLTSPFRWPHLGMSLTREKDQLDTALAYVDGVFDQALRAQDMKRADRALEFAERLHELVPGPQSAVALGEALRLAGRREAFADLTRTLRPAEKSSPSFGMVMALFARDIGDNEKAKSLLEAVLRAPSSGIFRPLAGKPPSEWPDTLRDITRPPELPPGP